MNRELKRFWDDDGGAEMVEWAVVTLVLLASTAAVMIVLRETLIDIFKAAFDKLQEEPPEAFP